MITIHTTSRRLLALAGVLGCLATTTFAQSLAVTNGTVVTYTGDFVPDTTGVDIPNYTFTTGLDNPVIDNTGNLYFRAAFTDSTTTLDPTSNNAWFYGDKRANLKMGLRAGTQAPGLPIGVLLRNGLTSTSALSANVRISPAGGYVWSPSNTWNSVDMTTTTQSLFGGPFSPLASQTLIQSQGDPAPGTTDTYAQTFSGIGLQGSSNNSNGHVCWAATLSGLSSDRFGVWEGLPGSMTLVQRSNNAANGVPSTMMSSTTGFGSQVEFNNNNEVMYDFQLSTINGATPATAATDRVYMRYTPPSTYTLVLREGSNAPGTFGGPGPGFATFNSISAADGWAINRSLNSFTRSGKVFFSSELRGGDVVAAPPTNVANFYYDGAGTIIQVARLQGLAPDMPLAFTGATFSALSATSHTVNDSGRVAFAGTLNIAGPITASNNTGIWSGTPGSLKLVVQAGQVMPNTGGSTAGAVSGSTISINDAGQVLFNVTLSGGSFPGTSLWVWDPMANLMPVLLAGDVVTATYGPGAGPKTLTGAFTSVANNNGDGAALRFTHTGYIGIKATVAAGSGGGSAMLVIRVPTVGKSFCSGDGTDTTCPCLNPGLPGRGCDNTALSGGATLSSGGVASISSDTLVLNGTNGVPFGSGLYFEGAMTANPTAPFGIAFGNGLRCSGGLSNRLEIRFADAAGASATTVPLGFFGFAVAGTTYYYQLWYRDGIPGIPTPFFACADTAGFNFSNGLILTWAP